MRKITVVVVATWGLLAPGSALALIPNVSQPSDLCAPTADPCIVADVAQIVGGAVLDFGARTLRIDPGGQLDIGLGQVTIRCGGLVVATGNQTAVNARAANGFGGFDGGVLVVEARGSCTASPTTSCVYDLDCPSGLCDGTAAGIDFDGILRGQGEWPAVVSLTAAGDVLVRRLIDLDADVADADGGEILLESGTSSVSIEGPISMKGGNAGAGGRATVTAARDIDVAAKLDASGGDVLGGLIDLDAARDVRIGASLLTGATAAGGSGGDVSVVADRDVSISAAGEIGSDGKTLLGGFAGDGGRQDILAGAWIETAAGSSLHSDGGSPDGYGGDLVVSAGLNARLAGGLSAAGGGAQGRGGSVEIAASGSCELLSASTIDVSGGSADGGTVAIDAGAYVRIAGTIDGSVSGGGVPSAIVLVGSGDVDFAGSILDSGAGISGVSQVEVEGCNVGFLSSSSIQNTASSAQNAVASHEQLTIAAGAQVAASGASGSNVFAYRSAQKAPVVSGTVTPAPTLSQNGQLTACGICGNAAFEVGESCDDGTAAWQRGEFCSARCTVLRCGDPDASGTRTATDALFVLTSAVGSTSCAPCLCDVDESGGANPVTATDSLRLLRVAVGQPVLLSCPACL